MKSKYFYLIVANCLGANGFEESGSLKWQADELASSIEQCNEEEVAHLKMRAKAKLDELQESMNEARVWVNS